MANENVEIIPADRSEVSSPAGGLSSWKERVKFAWQTGKLTPRYLTWAILYRTARPARGQIERAWYGIFPEQLSPAELAAAVHLNGNPASSIARRLQRILARATLSRAEFLRCLGEAGARHMRAAERILEHRFDLLGSGEVALGAAMDWHRDFKSGYRWPVRYYRTLKLVRFDDDSDVKVPWELSRFQHLFTLGKAYWLSGDEKYTQEFRSQIESWTAANPFKYGLNWQCAMEVAIRAVNWILAANFFRAARCCGSPFWESFLRTLHLHGIFIRENLEWRAEVRGNHYLSDIVGLIWLGAFFRETGRGQDWLRFGRDQLVQEMQHQVNPDGTHHESSTGYHRLVTELFLAGAFVLARNLDFFGLGSPVVGQPESSSVLDSMRCVCGSDFVTRLEKMLDFILHYVRPDGLAPLIGDADDGRLWIPTGYGEGHPADHRHLLAVGAKLFHRPDWLVLRDDQESREESWWLLGGEPRLADCEIPRESKTSSALSGPQSRAFPDGGFFRLSSERLWVFVRCGNHGMKGVGGHSHCDQLSFELAAGDQPVMVDPGTYVYSASPAARDLFRSTAYHNTVRVDGQDQNRFTRKGMFYMADDAQARTVKWNSNCRRDRLVGEHYGYCRLANPVLHQRTFLLDKHTHRLEVIDELLGRGEHALEWFFHFAPGPDPEMTYDPGGLSSALARVTVVSSDKKIELTWQGPSGAKVKLENGWVSSRYGARETAAVLVLSGTFSLPVHSMTLISCGVSELTLPNSSR